MTTTKPDTYQQVTDKLIEMLESAKEYGLPWHRLGMDAISPINVVSGNTYRGINIPMLWVSAEQNGYTHGRWATYKQWSDLGAQVKKGEKSTAVVFWKQFTYENDEGEVEKAGMFVRVYHVFNCAQVDGYEIPTTITLPEIRLKPDRPACCLRTLPHRVKFLRYPCSQNPLERTTERSRGLGVDVICQWSPRPPRALPDAFEPV